MRPLVLALVALGIAAAPASAAQRFATPDGSSSSPCTAASPCDVVTAVNNAVDGDEVILAPGDYPVTVPIFSDKNINVHGDVGHTRPRLLITGGGGGVQLSGATDSISYLDIEDSGSSIGGLTFAGALADRMFVHVSTTNSRACEIVRGTLRNSVCWASGPGNAAAIQSGPGCGGDGTANIVGVTAIADTTSMGTAINANANCGAQRTMNIIDSIARGSQMDIRATTDGSSAPNPNIAVTVSHTNYSTSSAAPVNGTATITDDGSKQTTTPAFVDETDGDFHEAPGAPTIDAGIADPNAGLLDIDGDFRDVGLAPDIGADEVAGAPQATTGAASAITASAGALAGAVDPNGGATTYSFQYGTTTGYGASTAVTPLSPGDSTVAVASALTGLAPHSTYHFRLSAENPHGTSTGADATFTTGKLPFAGVKVLTKKVRVKGRVAAVGLRCAAGTDVSCVGKVSLSITVKTKAHKSARTRKRTLVLGSAKFSVAAGARKTVKVKLSRRALRLLRSHKSLATTARVSAHDAGNTAHASKGRVKLLRPRAKKHRRH